MDEKSIENKEGRKKKPLNRFPIISFIDTYGDYLYITGVLHGKCLALITKCLNEALRAAEGALMFPHTLQLLCSEDFVEVSPWTIPSSTINFSYDFDCWPAPLEIFTNFSGIKSASVLQSG